MKQIAPSRRSMLVLALALAAAGAGAAETEALLRPALPVGRPERAVLLAAAQAGERAVAVGERGIIAVSADSGRTWKQVGAPVSVTLTAVRFADAANGVAVGHGGVVLTTADGGTTWVQRLDGRRAAALMVEAARSARNAQALQQAERLAAEGPDKPLLDVRMADARSIQVVGAYGLALASSDGGHSWTSWSDRLDNPKGLHLYALRQRGAVVLLAGEQGLVLRSDDGGVSFRRLETPYRGSFFTAELPGEHDIVLAGLRGNAWRSTDGGRSWVQLASPTGATITASVQLAAGELLLADQAGFVLKVAGQRLEPVNRTPLPPLTSVFPTADRRLLALTVQGVMAIDAAAPTNLRP